MTAVAGKPRVICPRCRRPTKPQPGVIRLHEDPASPRGLPRRCPHGGKPLTGQEEIRATPGTEVRAAA